MNFELGEEQIMLKNSAREFLDKECPKKHVRAMMDDEKGALEKNGRTGMAGISDSRAIRWGGE
jgi:hypothetical protein